MIWSGCPRVTSICLGCGMPLKRVLAFHGAARTAQYRLADWLPAQCKVLRKGRARAATEVEGAGVARTRYADCLEWVQLARQSGGPHAANAADNCSVPPSTNINDFWLDLAFARRGPFRPLSILSPHFTAELFIESLMCAVSRPIYPQGCRPGHAHTLHWFFT